MEEHATGRGGAGRDETRRDETDQLRMSVGAYACTKTSARGRQHEVEGRARTLPRRSEISAGPLPSRSVIQPKNQPTATAKRREHAGRGGPRGTYGARLGSGRGTSVGRRQRRSGRREVRVVRQRRVGGLGGRTR